MYQHFIAWLWIKCNELEKAGATCLRRARATRNFTVENIPKRNETQREVYGQKPIRIHEHWKWRRTLRSLLLNQFRSLSISRFLFGCPQTQSKKKKKVKHSRAMAMQIAWSSICEAHEYLFCVKKQTKCEWKLKIVKCNQNRFWVYF